MRWCIVEAALSTMIFVYTIKEAAKILSNKIPETWLWPPILPLVVFCAVCAAWAVLSPFLCTSRAQAAVDNMKAVTESVGTSSLRRGRSAESLDLDGVDLFEYHDVTTMAVSDLTGVIAGVLLWVVLSPPMVLLYYVVVMMICTDWAWFTCQSFSTNSLLLPMCVFFLLCLGCCSRVLYTTGVADQIIKLGEPCRTHPFSRHARAVVFAGSVLYAALVYLCPVPPMWRWGVIVTHTTRTLKVVYSLPSLTHQAHKAKASNANNMDSHRDQNEGGVEADGGYTEGWEPRVSGGSNPPFS